MLTLCIMPVFKGTRKETISALLICLTLDAIIILFNMI